MKATTYISALFLVISAAFSTKVNAQVSVNVNINTLPDWAPYEYVPETRYYYIPEIEAYYDIPSGMYIYFHNNGWIRSVGLPYHLRHFNMYNTYKVSLFDIGPNPYIHFRNHRIKYPRHYHRGYSQPTRVAYHNAPAPHRPMGFANVPHRPMHNNVRPNNGPHFNDNRGNNGPRHDNRNNVRPQNNRGNEPRFQNNRSDNSQRFQNNRGNNNPRQDRGNGPSEHRGGNGNHR